MKTFTYHSKHASYDNCILCESKFAESNKRVLYIQGDEGLITKCNVAIDGIGDDEIAVKDYSENEGMLDFLIVETGVVSEPIREINTGHVVLFVCKVNEEILKEYTSVEEVDNNPVGLDEEG